MSTACDRRAEGDAGALRTSWRLPAFPAARVSALLPAVALLLVALGFSACAYYNTYYLAKKYYEQGTEGQPYTVDDPKPASRPNFSKSIEYSKKLLAQYPDDKWVDDAYLLWARALIGMDDPREAIRMLEDFPGRFPNSGLRAEARFYLGVAARRARRHKDAVKALDDFLAREPRHNLVPYAYLERARALTALERHEEAAAAASQILSRFPKSALTREARIARAEGNLAQGAYDAAREDFRLMGDRARTDHERLEFLLREADCLEAARLFDEQLALLEDALAHQPVQVADSARVRAGITSVNQATEDYGRLLIRIGSTYLYAGRLEEAIASYRRVIVEVPRSALAAEAQFRIGYAYETIADDFEKARAEYGRVRDQGTVSGFATQALQRLNNLDRLAQFRSAEGDTVQKKAEAAFLLAEQYLFQLDKPERALEEYRRLEQEFPDTPIAAKALNAQAWVLSRKLERPAEAESLFWKVVREYPATESQLAARDYLEQAGIEVPGELIQLPEPPVAIQDTTRQVVPPPFGMSPLGPPHDRMAGLDSLRQGRPAPGRLADPGPPLAPADSAAWGTGSGSVGSGWGRDTTGAAPPPSADPNRAPTDSTLIPRPMPKDTTGIPRPVPPDSSGPGAGSDPESAGSDSTRFEP